MLKILGSNAEDKAHIKASCYKIQQVLDNTDKQIAHACSLKLIATCCRLYYQDSRGLAAMLKELSKSGHGQQALELFDCLQNLPPNHDLAPLADVFSYTTGKHRILKLGIHCSAQGSIASVYHFGLQASSDVTGCTICGLLKSNKTCLHPTA